MFQRIRNKKWFLHIDQVVLRRFRKYLLALDEFKLLKNKNQRIGEYEDEARHYLDYGFQKYHKSGLRLFPRQYAISQLKNITIFDEYINKVRRLEAPRTIDAQEKELRMFHDFLNKHRSWIWVSILQILGVVFLSVIPSIIAYYGLLAGILTDTPIVLKMIKSIPPISATDGEQIETTETNNDNQLAQMSDGENSTASNLSGLQILVQILTVFALVFILFIHGFFSLSHIDFNRKSAQFGLMTGFLLFLILLSFNQSLSIDQRLVDLVTDRGHRTEIGALPLMQAIVCAFIIGFFELLLLIYMVRTRLVGLIIAIVFCISAFALFLFYIEPTLRLSITTVTFTYIVGVITFAMLKGVNLSWFMRAN